jgi:hypothetical protein
MRFLPPTFLRELGMPRPSAVEHYLDQSDVAASRPSDDAALRTFGDAAGDDMAGELTGRKFFQDRPDAYGEGPAPWEDSSDVNRFNERSTLAVEASKAGICFRFTLRFRDLDDQELRGILLALCPQQFASDVGGTNPEGYCSKLGYARPLGMGSVRIRATTLHTLNVEQAALVTDDAAHWFRQGVSQAPLDAPGLAQWLDVHRHKHPWAGDYPRREGKIHAFHSDLRARHTKARRYGPVRVRT